jgi:predicted transcriptional regulator of viral defense system
LYIAWLRCGSHAVISHDSALELYDLTDAIPGAIHITVPRGTSLRHPGIRLHTSKLRSDEIAQWQGLPVTTIERTIADIAAQGAQEWLIQQAIQEALNRGRILPESLLTLAQRQRRPVREVLIKQLRQVHAT